MFEIRYRAPDTPDWAWVVKASVEGRDQITVSETRYGVVRVNSAGKVKAWVKKLRRHGWDGDFKLVVA